MHWESIRKYQERTSKELGMYWENTKKVLGVYKKKCEKSTGKVKRKYRRVSKKHFESIIKEQKRKIVTSNYRESNRKL